MRHPPPAGDIEIEGTETLAPIDTGATVNIMDMVTFDKLKTRPIIRHTKTRIYPYGSTTPLTLKGVTEATIQSGAEQIKTTFHMTEGQAGTLLGQPSSEALRLVSFAKQVQRDNEITSARTENHSKGQE